MAFMPVGTRSRVLLWTAGVVAVALYLAIVDLGIHAGRIHRGVEIEGGVGLGGLTLNEAVDKLADIGVALENEPLVFTAPGFDCRFTPAELGWRARPFSTAQAAMRVGRENAPLGALADRFEAFFGGVTVAWTGKPNTRKVGTFVQRCEKLGASFGYGVDKPELRFRVKWAIVRWPREQLHEIPAVTGS